MGSSSHTKNRRYYTEEQYLNYIKGDADPKRKHIAYARVSNVGQKDDLKNQEDFLRTYSNEKGVILDEFLTDIGSGLNYKRKKWNQLLDSVMQGDIDVSGLQNGSQSNGRTKEKN